MTPAEKLDLFTRSGFAVSTPKLDILIADNANLSNNQIIYSEWGLKTGCFQLAWLWDRALGAEVRFRNLPVAYLQKRGKT